MKIILILLLFVSYVTSAQRVMVVHGDTLWLKNLNTEDSVQLTKTVPTQTGQGGKVLSTTGTGFTWVSPTSGPQGPQGLQGPAGTNGTIITTGSSSQYLKGNLSLGTYSGYILNIQALTSSPTDAQTVYLGMLPKTPTTTAAISKIYVRQAGTITGAEIYCYSGTAGTAEAWSIYIRVNNTTDYLISTVSSATSERIFTNSGLSISLNSGDYFEIKSVNPTWVTNPLTTIFGGYIRID